MKHSRASHKGFTLIELLVVIAIIGILSSVVLASLSTARSRGSDAAVKRALTEARTQAELFYAANGNRYSAPPLSPAETTTNVCNPAALVSGVRGAYAQFKSAADAAGVSAANIYTAYNSAGAAGRATCHACPPGITAGLCGGLNSNAWAAEVPLKTGGFWCVDSSGFNGHNPAVGADSGSRLASGDTRCL